MMFDTLKPFADQFAPEIPHTPTNRYASIILIRETKSFAIFTTEGGEQQDVEETPAGFIHPNGISRLIMFKRKQVAPERRTGKALLRRYGVFPYAIDGDKVLYGEKAITQDDPIEDCYLTEGLCAHCPDCLTYGYAALEGQGARKSRVMTDTCFTVRPYEIIQRQMKFNVIDERKQTSGTITEYDYTTPGVFFPAVETTVDLTMDEFVYVLSNILRTTRYGKESSRQGFMRNHIVAIALSDAEIFANLEFTQGFYDAFSADDSISLLEGALSLKDFTGHAPNVIERLVKDQTGHLSLMTGDELHQFLSEVRVLNQDEDALQTFLQELNAQSATFVV